MWENLKSFTLRKVIIKLPRGFTLIELLVVIAIIAVIATATILVINPAELIKQGRDSTRLSDLNNINRSLGFLQVDSPSASFGTSSIVYVSIPDTSSTCANLGLASLPAGWAYACATDANHRNTDGTGWIPADFTSFSAGSPLSVLPIDPINTTSTGNYYTYVTGGSWELSSILEASKNRLGGGNDRVSEDGGDNWAVYEVGSNTSLSPISDSNLMGYWRFDEGSGITANDSSRNSNTGTLTNGPTWQSTNNCKTGLCLSFDGTNDYVNVLDSDSLDITGSITISTWVYRTSGNTEIIVTKSGAYQFSVINNNTIQLCYLGCRYSNSILTNNGWQHIAAVRSGSTETFYRNGSLVNSLIDGSIPVSNTNALAIGGYSGLQYLLDGRLDELRIYNRALSAAEIQAIYDATN